MKNSSINSTINSTTVRELAGATSLSDSVKVYMRFLEHLLSNSIATMKLFKPRKRYFARSKF